MPKVHVTDNNEVKSCEASIKDCKYGKIENSHFDDENAAQKEAEKRNTQQYGQFNVQEKPKKIYEQSFDSCYFSYDKVYRYQSMRA